MDLFEVMFNCRAMRRLKPDPVPEATLLRLVEAGNQAPSASNTQLTRWIIVPASDSRIISTVLDLPGTPGGGWTS